MTISPREILFTLKPLAPFHVGDTGGMGECADRVHSDTLWSALFQVAGIHKNDDLQQAMLSESFLISSTFPVLNDHVFRPRPFFIPGGEHDDYEDRWLAQRKQWRKTQFVSEGLFRQIIGGRETEYLDPDRLLPLPENCMALKTEFPDLPPDFWIQGHDSTAGNVVDRLTAMADRFDRTDLCLNISGGVRFAFLARLPEEVRPLFEQSLNVLGHSGIGGERSSGRGAFEVEGCVETNVSALPNVGDRVIALSLYHPTEAEVSSGLLEHSRYHLTVRGGFMDRVGFQKKRLNMMAEGADLSVMSDGVMGDIVDVRPDGWAHPVYRYGRLYPLTLPTATKK